VFSHADGTGHIGVAIGDQILDFKALVLKMANFLLKMFPVH